MTQYTLIASWYDLGSLQKSFCLLDGEVWNSNGFTKTLLYQLLHGLQSKKKSAELINKGKVQQL